MDGQRHRHNVAHPYSTMRMKKSLILDAADFPGLSKEQS